MKTMFKRTLSIILAAMILLCIVMVANAETAGIVDRGITDSGIDWTLDSEGHLVLSGEGPMFGRNPQKQPDVPWFLPHRNDIKMVTVGYGITDVGKHAFNGCRYLESVSLPVSITSINSSAFNGCVSLSEITLPANITYISERAFSGCSSLTSIIIPQKVYHIGEFAFSRSGLRNLGICSNETGLGEKAFAQCVNLDTVTLSVNNYSAADAFWGCDVIRIVNYTGTRDEWFDLPFVKEGNNTIMWNDINYNSQGIRYIEDMYVSTPPQKMVYHVGEEPDFTGMALTVIWNDGTVEEVTDLSGIKVWDFDVSYRNNAEVTFEYQLNTVNFYIPVVDDSSTEIIGSCGPHSRWILNLGDNHRMVIVDEGGLYELDRAEKYPWNEWASKIFFLYIDENISHIGDNAFANIKNMYSLDIISNKTTFGDNVFGNEEYLYEIWYYGTIDEWKNLEAGENNNRLYNAENYYFNNELHNHTYSEIISEEASCTEPGIVLYKCECQKSYTKEIPASEHKIKNVSVPATCSADGMEYKVCEVCGNTAGETVYIPALPHSAGDWESDGANCIVRKCTACGETVEKAQVTVNKTPEPEKSEVDYGDTVVLDSGVTGTLPEGVYIVWSANNNNFNYEISEDGKTCAVTAVKSGETTFTATVYDVSGNVIAEAVQIITSNAGTMEKIADFFGKIFDLFFGLFG